MSDQPKPENDPLDGMRFRAIVDASINPIVTIDSKGDIQTFNAAAESAFGYLEEEVIGKNVRLLMPNPHRDNHDGYLKRYIDTGEARIIGRGREVEAQRKDGTRFPVELAVSEARVGKERIFAAILKDITERRRAEAELRELQRVSQQRERLADVGAITAKIVHDLGNPLSALSMQAQLILKTAQRLPNSPVSDVTENAQQIVSEIHRLSTLVRSYMSFAREQRLVIDTIDLPDFIKGLVSFWEPATTAQQHTIMGFVEDHLGPLHADRDKLKRVLDNLIKNASEAIGDRPGRIEIHVSALPDKQKIRISVRDSGPGLPENIDVFRLFETTKNTGSGLGLAIVKQLVRAHGGDTHFESNTAGTTFLLDFPDHS